jgi:hypothetical protein
MARIGPKPPLLKRRSAFIEPKVRIFVACEGRVTEPEYLKDCIEHFGSGLVHLEVLPERGEPLTLVRHAVEARSRLLEAARHDKKKGLQPIPFKVWAMFDKDEHQIEEAIALAENNGIDIAYSNPCFELWAVLHLAPYGAQDGRHQLQRRLNELMPRYHHEHSPRIDYDQIKDHFETADQRARAHCEARIAEGTSHGCPQTNVGTLVRKIKENGRIAFRR